MMIAVFALAVQMSWELPKEHELKRVMGRDYWTLLSDSFYGNEGDPTKGGLNDPAVRGVPAFEDCGLVNQTFTRPPKGHGAYRKTLDNWADDDPGKAMLLKNRRPDKPLALAFWTKRWPAAMAGDCDVDVADWEAFKKRFPNLVAVRHTCEWGNEVLMLSGRGRDVPEDNGQRADFEKRWNTKPLPSTKQGWLDRAIRYADRCLALHWNDKSLMSTFRGSICLDHLGGALGAKTITMETTNTSFPPDEYRWNIMPMFARGAARQFSIPWCWYVAIYMNGHKADGSWQNNSVRTYRKTTIAPPPEWGGSPVGGVSPNLFDRVSYFAYLQGAGAISPEDWMDFFLKPTAGADGVCALPDKPKDGAVGVCALPANELSGPGKTFAKFHDFTAAHPDRGAPWCPVAVLVPFNQGYTAYGGKPWAGRAGYSQGDNAIDSVFFSLVPGFDRKTAMLKGEEHNLWNSPYAMMYDVLCPDSPQPQTDFLKVLKTYKAAILVGDYAQPEAFAATLSAYEKAGGKLIRITSDQLPPMTATAAEDTQTGKRTYPKVAAILKDLQEKHFPFAVKGDVVYGANRTKTGWWLWAINNNGVTKFTDRDEEIDKTRKTTVEVNLKNVNALQIDELVSGTRVLAHDGAFSFELGAGEVSVFEIVEAKPCAETRVASWRFRHPGEAWREVTLPHDWAIGGPFATNFTGKIAAGGALPWIGRGEYETTVEVPAEAKYASLFFDGAMSEAHVFVDGTEIAYHPNGYNRFEADFSKFLGKKTTFAVRVTLENPPDSSRWYPGAGLYRPVRLVTGGVKHLHPWETFVRTAKVDSDGTARLFVVNDHPGIRHTLVAADGSVAAEGYSSLEVKNAKLWTPETPHLYRLLPEGIRIGIRTLAWQDGSFRLNGVARKFKGVCLHHDLGPFGAAFEPAAFKRQVALLKSMGCDSIRTSHNMPAPEMIDLCDELGMMVVDEAFDEWDTAKKGDNENGIHRFFPQWWKKDLDNFVRADRNHPSVVMWSLGNEIPEQGTDACTARTREMVSFVHSLDTSRSVTVGHSWMPYAIAAGGVQEVDVPGTTYRLPFYDALHEASLFGGVIGIESASTVSTRGFYRFPAEVVVGPSDPAGRASSYDLEYGGWANLPDDNFAIQADKPYTLGEFVWTGFDYLGEPYPFGTVTNNHSANYGIFDLGGIPKDRYYLYRSVWNPSVPTLHVLPHWTWPGREGRVTPVFVYSNADEVELFVNGVSQGRRRKDAASRLDRFRFRWTDVVYHPGELKAVAYDAVGKQIGEETVRTAGAFARLTTASETYAHAGRTLTFTTVCAVDKDGTPCPDAAVEVDCAKLAPGTFRCATNGDPTDPTPFCHPIQKTFHGHLVIVSCHDLTIW